MDFIKIIEPLIPTLVELMKEALSFNDYKTAEGILLGILGTSEENRTRVVLALEEAKKQEFYKRVKEELESTEKKLAGIQPPA
jgi:hypothetical protein